MMIIKVFVVNPLGENCYVAYDEATSEGVIIDCGCSTESEWRQVKRYIDDSRLTIRHLLCTHLHFDHVWGNPYVAHDLGLSPEAGKADLPLYDHMGDMLASMFGAAVPVPAMPPVARFLADGDEVSFGDTTLRVIATPGHSQGSLCFYGESDEVLFAGDTLFRESVGRTDLEGGSMQSIVQSVSRLASLPESTTVLCGHGPYTTIGHERQHNPYL